MIALEMNTELYLALKKEALKQDRSLSSYIRLILQKEVEDRIKHINN